jgi:hypothetical protein
MGRPINKKYFANTNAPYDDAQTGGLTGVGGEGVSTVVVGSSGTNYSEGATITFSNPQISGGSTATGSATVTSGNGGITAVSVTSNGAGYTSTATITVTTATGVNVAGTGTSGQSVIYVTTSGLFVGMSITGTGVGASAKINSIASASVVPSVANASTVTGTLIFRDDGSGASFVTSLTSSQQNGITVYAYVPGGSSGVIGDIMKQEASRRYLVQTAQGSGQCILVTTSTLASGEMYITASDVLGNTYFVDKLTSRKARLYQYNLSTGSYEYADGDVTRWSLDTATTGTVQIANN